MFLKVLFVSVIILSSQVTAVAKPKVAEPSGLELQQIQSRDLEGVYDIVFPAVLSVLQDEGYVLTSADKATGLVTGRGQSKSGLSYNIWTGIGRKNQFTNVSAFIEPLNATISKVRLNFVASRNNSGAYGINSNDDKMITDGLIYSNAFEKIEQAIFVRTALKAPAPTPTLVPAPVPTAVVPTATTPATIPATTPK
jgi:hypothetical protein